MTLNHYKKALLILLLAFLTFIPVLAEDEPEKEKDNEIEKLEKFMKKKRINAGYLILGARNMNLSNLNNYLTSNGHPAVQNSTFTIGLGGHVIHNKTVVGVEIVRTRQKPDLGSGEFSTSARATHTTLNIGRLIFFKKGTMAYPYFGIGAGTLTMRITEHNIDSFGDITGYQKGSEAKRNNLLVNIGFATDYFYKYREKKKGQNNLFIGLRVGWLLSPTRGKWRVNNFTVDDGPDSGITGPYIRLTIGLGGWVERLIKVYM